MDSELRLLPTMSPDDALEALSDLRIPTQVCREAIHVYADGNAEVEREFACIVEVERSRRRRTPKKRFVKKSLLGTGATAAVHEGVDTDLDRPIALKIFNRPGVERHYEMIAQEARAAACVESQYVVQVHDVIELDDKPTIVMHLCREFRGKTPVRAISLDDPTASPESVNEAVKWVRQAALGIDAGHIKGVFHRDLKPQNILLGQVSRDVKVTDFGLAVTKAKAEASAAQGSPRHRGASVSIERSDGLQIAGTPPFMAPEAARGLHRNIDMQSLIWIDIYGLGATLYTLVAGAPPYQARPSAEDAVSDILAQVCTTPYKPLKFDRWGKRVPRRLIRIVAKAMSSTAEDRYVSAAALADDLSRYLSWNQTSCDVARPVLASALFFRRNRVAVAQVIAALSLCILAALTWFWGEKAAAARSQAEAAEIVKDRALRSRDIALGTTTEAKMEVLAARDREREAKRKQGEAEMVSSAALFGRQEAEHRRRAVDQQRLEARAELEKERQQRVDAEAAFSTKQSELSAEQALRAKADKDLLAKQSELSAEQALRAKADKDLLAKQSELSAEQALRAQADKDLLAKQAELSAEQALRAKAEGDLVARNGSAQLQNGSEQKQGETEEIKSGD